MIQKREGSWTFPSWVSVLVASWTHCWEDRLEVWEPTPVWDSCRRKEKRTECPWYKRGRAPGPCVWRPGWVSWWLAELAAERTGWRSEFQPQSGIAVRGEKKKTECQWYRRGRAPGPCALKAWVSVLVASWTRCWEDRLDVWDPTPVWGNYKGREKRTECQWYRRGIAHGG